jgi:hypothetical protein
VRRLVAALVLLILSGVAREARAFEPDGFWYVLVYYQDSETANTDRWHWDDRVWSFAKKGGGRLEWTEYPIVEFADNSGRFEAARGGRATRVLGKWEPNEAQLADIRDGLAANTRGVKTKTLKPAGGASWTSGEGGSADSALVITYSETWKIDGLPNAPVFERDDSMGSAATESMSGRTVYKTASISANGDLLEGTFERDGTREGHFRMMRSAPVGEVAKHTQEERHRLQFQRSMATASDADVMQMFAGQITLPAAAADKDPKKAHDAIRESVSGVVRASGNDENAAAPLIDRMTTAIEKQFAQGKSLDEVQKMLTSGQLAR